MRLLTWWLRKVIGEDLARDIIGDVAESGGGIRRLAVIAAGITLRRFHESIGAADGRLGLPAGIVSDLRFAIRSLRRSPWYAATTIGVIALSMALATTVFAVVDGVLFKRLPYPDPAHTFMLTGVWSSEPRARIGPSWADIDAWRRAVPDATIAFGNLGSLIGADEGRAVRSASVSKELFDVLGQQPILGGFQPEDFRKYAAGEPRPILISYRVWQASYHGDPGVLGAIVHGEGGQLTKIAGVLAADFLFPTPDGRFVPDALEPLRAPADMARNRGRVNFAIARTPHGLPASVFQARIAAATLQLKVDFPRQPGERSHPYDLASATPLDVALGGDTRRMFAVAFTASAALLLLACLNVAGLSATRVEDRRHELDLRTALGGGRRDLVRLLASEAAVIVGAGAAIGLALSIVLVRVVSTVLPQNVFLLKPLAVDARVAAFAVIGALVSIALTLIGPARAVGRRDLRAGLAENGRARRSRTAGRFVVVTLEVAIGLAIAIVGTLVGGSLARVWRQDPGYDPANTLYLEMRLRGAPAAPAVDDEVLSALRALPGVTAAGASTEWYMNRAMTGSNFESPAGALPEPGLGFDETAVMPGFLEAAGLRLLDGRMPTSSELLSDTPVVVVNDIVARTYWPGRRAVGQTLMRNGRVFTVIGVVPAAHHLALDLDPDGLLYYPMGASSHPLMTMVLVRFAAGHPADASSVLAALRTPAFSRYAVNAVMTMTGAIGESIRTRKFQALIFASFGVAAVCIVGVGVFGLVAMVTARRTREVGVRMALGARTASIVGLIVRQELAAVLAGIAIGAVASWWTTTAVKAYLFKTTAHDPAMWTAAIAVLLIVGLAGALIPALRASRIDPVNALRVQ